MIRMMMLRPEKMMALICDEAEVLHRSASDMQESGITCFLERFLSSPADKNEPQAPYEMQQCQILRSAIPVHSEPDAP